MTVDEIWRTIDDLTDRLNENEKLRQDFLISQLNKLRNPHDPGVISPDQFEYITVKEVMYILGKSRSTVHELTQSGRLLKYKQQNGKILFLKHEVLALLNTQYKEACSSIGQSTRL